MRTNTVTDLGGPLAPQTTMTNDYGQNADYRNTEIVLAQQRHFIYSVQRIHTGC